MITADLDAALAALISHGSGFAGDAGTATSAGTWRRAQPGGGGPGTYATTIAFRLARRGGASPASAAARLAAALLGLDWVERAAATGNGYVTVTVTQAALATLAVRITQAGPGCVRGAALAGVTASAPRSACLASAPSWAAARRRLAAVVTGRLAEAAGAEVRWTEDHSKRMAPANPPSAASPSPLADAIAYAGADAITYALARLPPGGHCELRAQAVAAHHLGNPAYAVRYAHAHAATTLRQAADLGLGPGDAAEFEPRLLAHPRELSLLAELSWLAERVAAAARRARPDVLARHLETLAGAYLDCQESCPALAPGSLPYEQGGVGGGPGAPGPPPTPPRPAELRARLWRTAAARTALGAGLGLLGVAAPDRL